MAQNLNPYETNPVGRSAHFIGRRRESAVTEKMLREGVQQGTNRLRYMLITGEEGTGKTSLLLHMGRLAAEKDYIFIYANARMFRTVEHPMVSYLAFYLTELMRHVQQRIQSDIPNFSVYLAALQGLPLDQAQLLSLTTLQFPSHYYGYIRNANVGVSHVTPWYQDVQRILDLAGDRANVHGCIFALDDTDTLRSTDVSALLDLIQAVYESPTERRVAFAIAGDPSLRTQVQQQRGAAPIFHDFQLQPWSLDEAAEYVRRPELQDLGIRVTDGRIRELLEDTEGSPSLLANLCSRIYEACLTSDNKSFEANETILEQVCEDIGAVSDQNAIQQIGNLSRHDLHELGELMPYSGWTIEQIARYHAIKARAGGQKPDIMGKQQQLRLLRDSYVRQGILKPDSQITVAGTGLERAFTRLRARKAGVAWDVGYLPRYSEWIEGAVRSYLVAVSERANFPFRPWASWRVPAKSSPTPLGVRITEWVRGFADGTYQPSSDSGGQLRLVEDDQGRLAFKLVARETPLMDLTSTQLQIGVDLFGLQFSIGGGGEGTAGDKIIEVYKLPSNSVTGITPILTAFDDIAALVDLQSTEHWTGRFELPNLREVVVAATRAENKPLLLECLYTCIRLGRVTFSRGELQAALEWRRLAASMPSDLVPTDELANAHNALAFVSLALRDWEFAKREFRIALDMYSSDVTRSNRAMTSYDIAYAEAKQGMSDQAIATCEASLKLSNNDTRCTSLFVKLVDIDDLPLDHYWDGELSREPNVSASIYCTLGAVHAQRRKWPAAEEALGEARKLDGRHYMVLRAWGHYYLKRGRFEDAERAFLEARDSYQALVNISGQPTPAMPAILDEIAFAHDRVR